MSSIIKDIRNLEKKYANISWIKEWLIAVPWFWWVPCRPTSNPVINSSLGYSFNFK